MPDELKAENEQVESVSTPEEAPTTETNTPDPKEESAEPEGDAPKEEVEETDSSEPEKVSSKSAQGRIKQLNNKLKEEQRIRSELEEKVQSIMQENEENPFSPVNMPSPSRGRFAQPNENGEITYEDYQRDVQNNAKAAVQAVLSQQQLKQEAADVVRVYPQLDPNNKDTFDEDLSAAVTEAVAAKHRLSANFSIKQTVDKLMKPYLKAAERAVDSQKRELVSQVASGGIRPGSSPSPEADKKGFEDLSLEEMEAKLGKVY